MYNPNLYWDLLALGVVIVCALLVAVLLWIIVRMLRKKWAHSVEFTPPMLCTPAMSPPPTDGSSLPMSTERQMSLSGRLTRRKSLSPSAEPDVEDGGLEQRQHPKAFAAAEAEDKTKCPAEGNDQRKEQQLTKESQRKEGKSHSGDEKSCSSKVKRKSKFKHHGEKDTRTAGVSGSTTEAGSAVAATVAEGVLVSASTAPIGVNQSTPVPASGAETPPSLFAPVALYATPIAPVSAAGRSQLRSHSGHADRNSPGFISATPPSVPSSAATFVTPSCGEILPTGTPATSDTVHSTPRRRRSTRSKGSKGSGSSRRSDHHREPQAHHSSGQPQRGAISRDPSGKHATEDGAQSVSPAPDTGPRAVTPEFQAEKVSAAPLVTRSQLESRCMSPSQSPMIFTRSAPANENGAQPALPQGQRAAAEAQHGPPQPLSKPNRS